MHSIASAALGFIVAAAIASVNCGGNGVTSPSPGGGGSQTSQGLVGTWQATRAEFVSRTNSNVRMEVVSQGTTLTLVLDASGSYTRTIRDPGNAGSTETGTWTASQDVLTLRPNGVSFSIQFDYSLSDSTLTLGNGHVQFDFNSDGVMEEAILNATLTRR